MKRTKDGGAILENGTRLDRTEFMISRITRDMIRVLIILCVILLDYFIFGEYLLSYGTMLIMTGWRLQTGW